MQDRDRETSARPERVRKLKKMILALLVAVMVLPMVAAVLMLFRIRQLNSQLDEMEKQVALLQQSRESDDGVREPADSSPSDAGSAGMAVKAESVPRSEGNDAAETETATEEMTDIAGQKAAETTDSAKESTPERICKVYLTFDDGPSSNTGRILDLLAKYDVKATFFVTGKEGPVSESLYRRIVDEGHTLGMHSYTHKYSEIYESKQAFVKDLEKLQNYLYEITGVWPRFYRFPGGSSNEVSTVSMQELADYLKEQDIYYLDWNVASGDAMGTAQSAGVMAQRVLGMIGEEETQVVMMHDAADKSATVDALAIILEELTGQDGVEILQVSEDMDFGPVQHLKSE